MALADKIKGLNKHKIEVPTAPLPAAVTVFDNAQADKLLRQINSAIGAAYPSGCLEWIIANRDDVWKSLCAGENAVDTAYLQGDMPALVKAIDLLQRMYLNAFDLFTTRPPVVEVQERLSL